MALVESLIGPLASIIDKIIPDKEAGERAKIELVKLEGTQELQAIQARLSRRVQDERFDMEYVPQATPSGMPDFTAFLLATPSLRDAIQREVRVLPDRLIPHAALMRSEANGEVSN